MHYQKYVSGVKKTNYLKAMLSVDVNIHDIISTMYCGILQEIKFILYVIKGTC